MQQHTYRTFPRIAWADSTTPYVSTGHGVAARRQIAYDLGIGHPLALPLPQPPAVPYLSTAHRVAKPSRSTARRSRSSVPHAA
eukprot:2018984-Rhodomonas_salina.1